MKFLAGLIIGAVISALIFTALAVIIIDGRIPGFSVNEWQRGFSFGLVVFGFPVFAVVIFIILLCITLPWRKRLFDKGNAEKELQRKLEKLQSDVSEKPDARSNGSE